MTKHRTLNPLLGLFIVLVCLIGLLVVIFLSQKSQDLRSDASGFECVSQDDWNNYKAGYKSCRCVPNTSCKQDGGSGMACDCSDKGSGAGTNTGSCKQYANDEKQCNAHDCVFIGGTSSQCIAKTAMPCDHLGKTDCPKNSNCSWDDAKTLCVAKDSNKKGSGSGAPALKSKAPVGYLDSADCTNIKGWAWDPDSPNQSIFVHVYMDGSAGQGKFVLQTTANVLRTDLKEFTKDNMKHGFVIQVPKMLKDGKEHKVFVNAINTDGTANNNPSLTGGGKVIKCSP